MENYYNQVRKSPIFALFIPWENFTRASPVLWIFLASVVMLFVGLNVKIFSLFIWIGGFLVAFIVAVALSFFENSF